MLGRFEFGGELLDPFANEILQHLQDRYRRLSLPSRPATHRPRIDSDRGTQWNDPAIAVEFGTEPA